MVQFLEDVDSDNYHDNSQFIGSFQFYRLIFIPKFITDGVWWLYKYV